MKRDNVLGIAWFIVMLAWMIVIGPLFYDHEDAFFMALLICISGYRLGFAHGKESGDG